jgi:3'(2'), 5'-bisphosphate nucleotidase/myo-inositol-1(or 4)-monophosphatase
MKLNTKQLNDVADAACVAARAAGAAIRTYTGGDVAVQYKEGGDSLASQVVTEVDLRSQTVILDRLAGVIARFELGLLTEELSDDGSRFERDYFWCIDPLDGTLPFTQGKAGYAVSIALVERSGQAVIGVAYDPVQDRLYRAVAGQGVTINEESFRVPEPVLAADQALHFCMDCTFDTDPQREQITADLESLAQRLGYNHALVEVRGGAVCNACYVLEHGPAAYLKAPKPELGGGSIWDFAAISCIFQEAGAAVGDFRGQPLDLNSRNQTFFNHCGVSFVSDLALAASLQSVI